nr:uncharacterized protein LOC111426213 isoform X1 [Onthophagus taurus]
MYSSVRASHANFKSRRRKYPISFRPERPNGRFKFRNFCACFRKKNELEKKFNSKANLNSEKFDKEKLEDDIAPILKEITSKFFEKEFNKYFDKNKENPEECLSTTTFLSTSFFQLSRPIKLDAYPISLNYQKKSFNRDKGTQYLSATSLQSGVEDKLFTDMKDETTQTDGNKFNFSDKITQYSDNFRCNKETNTSNISQKSTTILFANQSKMFESTDDTLKEDEVDETRKKRSVRINLGTEKRSCCTSTSDTCIYEEIQSKFFEWLEFVRKNKNQGDTQSKIPSILIKPKNDDTLKTKPSIYKLKVKATKKVDETEERKEALSKVAEFLTSDNPILTEDIQKSLNKLSGNRELSDKQRYPTFIGTDIKVNNETNSVLDDVKKKRVPKIIIGKKKLKNQTNEEVEEDSIKKVDFEIDAITSKMEKYLEVLLHDDQSSLGSDSVVESPEELQRMELCPLENQSVCKSTPVTLLHPLLHNIHMKTLNKKDSNLGKDSKKIINKVKSEEKKEFKFGNLFKKKVEITEPKPTTNQTFNILNVSTKDRGTCYPKNELADISTMAGNSLFISVDKSTNTINEKNQSMGVQTINNVRNKKLLAVSKRNTFHIGVQTNLDDLDQDDRDFDDNERILYARERKVNELHQRKVKKYFFKAKKVVTELLNKGKYSNSWSNTEEIDEEDSNSIDNLNIPLKVQFSNVVIEGDAKDSTTKIINLPKENSDIDDDNDDDFSDDEVFKKQTVLSLYTWSFSNKDEDRFLKNEKKSFESTYLGGGDNNFFLSPPKNYFNRLITYPVITENVNKHQSVLNVSPGKEKVKIISSKIKKKKIAKKKKNNESKRIKKPVSKKAQRNSPKELFQPKLIQEKVNNDISIYKVDNYIQFRSSSSIVDQEFLELKRSEQKLKDEVKTPVKIEVTKSIKDELINDRTLKGELISTFHPIGPDDIKLIEKESDKSINDESLILTLKKNLLTSPQNKSEIKEDELSLVNSDIFGDLPSDIVDEILDELGALSGDYPLIHHVEEPTQDFNNGNDGELEGKRSWGQLADRYKKMFLRKKKAKSKSKLNLVNCCKRPKKKKEIKIKEAPKKKIFLDKKQAKSKRKWYHFWKPPEIRQDVEDSLDLIEEEKPYPFEKNNFEPVLISGDLVGKTKVITKPLPRITRAFPKIKEIGKSPEDLLLTSSVLLKLTPQREQIEKFNLQLAYGGTPSTRHTLSLPKNTNQHIYNLQQILPGRNSLVLVHQGSPSLKSSTITISERLQITSDSDSTDDYLFRAPPRLPKSNLDELEIIRPKTVYLVSGLRQHISDEMLMTLLRTYLWRMIRKPMITDIEPCLEGVKVEEDDTGASLSAFDEEEEVQEDVGEVEETKEDDANQLNFLREVLRGKDELIKRDVEKVDDGIRYDILVSDDEIKKEAEDIVEGVVEEIIEAVVAGVDERVVEEIIEAAVADVDEREVEEIIEADVDEGVEDVEEVLVQKKEEEIKVVDFPVKPKLKNAFEHASSGVGKPILEITDEFRAFLKSMGVFEPPEVKGKKKRPKIIIKKSVQTSKEFHIEKLKPSLDDGLILRSTSLPEIKPLSGGVKKIKSSFCNIKKPSKIAFKTSHKPMEIKETKKIYYRMKPKPKIIKRAPLQPIFHEECKISCSNKECLEKEVVKYEEKNVIEKKLKSKLPVRKRKFQENKSIKVEKNKAGSSKIPRINFKNKSINEKILRHLESRKCPKSCRSLNVEENSDEKKSKIRFIKSKIRKSAKIEVEKFNKLLSDLKNLQKNDSENEINKKKLYKNKFRDDKKGLKNVVTLNKSQTQTERFQLKKCPETCKVQSEIKKSSKFVSKINRNQSENEPKRDVMKIIEGEGGVKEDSTASDDVKDSKCLKIYDKMKSKLVKTILEASKSQKFSSSSVITLNKSSTQTDEENEIESNFTQNETTTSKSNQNKSEINNEKKSLRFQDDFDKNDEDFPKSGESQKNEVSTESPKSTESSRLLIKIKRNNFDSSSTNIERIETPRTSEKPSASTSTSTSTEPELSSKRFLNKFNLIKNRTKNNAFGYQCGVWGNPFYNTPKTNQINNEIKVTSYSSTISDDGNLAQIIKKEVKLINFDPPTSFTSSSSFLSSPSQNSRVNRRLLAQEIANDIKKKSELFKRNKTSSSFSENISKINYFNPKDTDYNVNYFMRSFNSVDKLDFFDTSFSVNEGSIKYPSNLIAKEDLVGEETKPNGIKCRLEFIYRKMPIAVDSELGLFSNSREFSEGVSEMKKRKKSKDVLPPKSFFAEPIECFTATAAVDNIQTGDGSDKENNNFHDLYLIKSDTIVRRDDPNGAVSASKSSEDFFCPPQAKKAKTFKANLNNVFKECNDIFQKVKRFHQPMIDPLMKSNVLCLSKKRELNFPMIEDLKKKKKKSSRSSLNGSDDSKRSKRKTSKDHTTKDHSLRDASKENSQDDLNVTKDDDKTESKDSITTVTYRSNPTLSVETDTTRTIESSGPSSLNCDGQCQTEGLCYCKMSKGNNNQIKHSRPVKVMDKEQRDFGNNYQALIKPYTCCIHAKEEGRNYCKKVTFDQMRRNEEHSVCTDSSITSIEAVKKLIGKRKRRHKDKSMTKILNCGKGTVEAVVSEGYKEEPNSKMSGYVDKKRRKSINLRRSRKSAERGSETSSKDTSSTKIPFFRRLFKSKRERSKSKDKSKVKSKHKRNKEKEKQDVLDKLPPGIRRLQASYNEKYMALKRRMRKDDHDLEFGLCNCPKEDDSVVIVESGKKNKKKCCAKKGSPQNPQINQPEKNEFPITTKCACNILEQQSKGKETPGIKRRPRLIKKRSKSNEVTPKSSQRSILKKISKKKKNSTQYEEPPQDKKLTFEEDLKEENDVSREESNAVVPTQNVKTKRNRSKNSVVSDDNSRAKRKNSSSSKFKPPKKSKKQRKLEEQLYNELDPKVIDPKGCICDDVETFSSIVVRTPDPSEPGCCSKGKKKSEEPPKKKASKSKSKSKSKHSSEGKLSTKNTSKSRVKTKKVEKCEKAKKGSNSQKSDSSKCFCDYEEEDMKRLLLTPHPSMIKNSSAKSTPKSSLRSSKRNSFLKPHKARSKGSSRISSEEFVQAHEYDVRRLELPPTLLNIYRKPNKKIPRKDEIFETLISMLFKEKRNKRGENTRKRMVKKYLSQVSSTELEDIVLELVRSLPNGLQDILGNNQSDEITFGVKNKQSQDNQIKLNVSKTYLKRFKNQVQLERNVFCSKYLKQVAISCSEDCSCIAEPCSSGVSDVNDDMVNYKKTDYTIDVDKVEVFCRNYDSWCSLSSSDKGKKNQNRLIKEQFNDKLSTSDDSKEIVELIRLLSTLSPKDLCGYFSKQCMK